MNVFDMLLQVSTLLWAEADGRVRRFLSRTRPDLLLATKPTISVCLEVGVVREQTTLQLRIRSCRYVPLALKAQVDRDRTKALQARSGTTLSHNSIAHWHPALKYYLHL